ncbi:unnamed protein product [Sympodiomycopsis kandeliae]
MEDVVSVLESINEALSQQAGVEHQAFKEVPCSFGLVTRVSTLNKAERQMLEFLATQVRGLHRLGNLIPGGSRDLATDFHLAPFDAPFVDAIRQPLHLLITDCQSKTAFAIRNEVLVHVHTQLIASAVQDQAAALSTSIETILVDAQTAKSARSHVSTASSNASLQEKINITMTNSGLAAASDVILVRGANSFWLLVERIKATAPSSEVERIVVEDIRLSPQEGVKGYQGTIADICSHGGPDIYRGTSTGPWLIFKWQGKIFVPCPDLFEIERDNVDLKQHQRTATALAAIVASHQGDFSNLASNLKLSTRMHRSLADRYTERAAASRVLAVSSSLHVLTWINRSSSKPYLTVSFDRGTGHLPVARISLSSSKARNDAGATRGLALLAAGNGLETVVEQQSRPQQGQATVERTWTLAQRLDLEEHAQALVDKLVDDNICSNADITTARDRIVGQVGTTFNPRTALALDASTPCPHSMAWALSSRSTHTSCS